jgi:uncharacterized protein (TIGR03437 family)
MAHTLRCWWLATLFAAAASCQGLITTVAGTDWLFPANGKAARNAPLGRVAGVAIDNAGNLLVADPDNAQVFRIDVNGVITVVAGNGITGFSGDNGPAAGASLQGPTGVAVDSAGNIYVADAADYRVRKVSAAGIISTFAGTGHNDYSGDGGPAVAARVSVPNAVAVDRAGNVYIADTGNGRVRKVTPDGRITTIAGTGGDPRGPLGDGGPASAAIIGSPTDLVFDAAGNLYVADSYSRLVRKIDSSGVIRTVAGSDSYASPVDGVPALTASLRGPLRIALTSAGLLYITDTTNNIVRMVDASGIIKTIAGNGQAAYAGDGGAALSASLDSPAGIAVDAAGNLLIADSLNQRVRRVTPAGTLDTVAGNAGYRFGGDGGPALAAQFNQPAGVAADGAGNLYIVDTLGNRVRKLAPNGAISTIAGTGERGYAGDGGPATSARLFEPRTATLDSAGNLYISDSGNQVVRKVSADGKISTIAGTGSGGYSGDGLPATQARLSYPEGIGLDPAGNLYVADTGSFTVRKIGVDGTISTYAGNASPGSDTTPSGDGGPATNAALGYLDGLAVDRAGNVYVTEIYLGRVRRIDPSGKISTVAGLIGATVKGDGGPATKAYINPTGLAVDAAGNLLIADQGFSCIRRVNASTGIISTIAGDDDLSFSGDGGSAVLAALHRPTGVTTDATGNIYIADTQNHRVRAVTNTQPPFQAAPDSLAFSANSGGAAAVEQQIVVTSSLAGVVFSAKASDNWLSVTPDAGLMPGVLQVSADPSSLSVGTYSGQITITAGGATPPARVVPVVFNVAPADTPTLVVEPGRLDFDRVQGADPQTYTLRVLNNGSGALDFTLSTTTTSGGAWLSAVGSGGTATAGSPMAFAITANPAGLAPGTYAGLITVAATKSTQRVLVPVSLTVNGSSQTIVLSQSGLTFIAVAGSGTPAAQSLGVLNTGVGTMNWTVAADTTSGGNWLSVSPASGASGPASSNVGIVQVSVNPSGLTAGEYYGRVRVTAPDAANSPQTAEVVLRILAQGTQPPPDVRPTGFIFVAPADGTAPPAQTAQITNLGAATVTFVSSSSGGFFQYQPSTGSVAPGQPATLQIEAQAGLSAGIRRGSITLQFSDGSVRPIDVLLAVPAAGSTVSPALGISPRAGACSPQSLNPVFTLLGQQFVVPASWPVSVEVRVVDDCGTFLNSGTVVLTFSNADAPVTMVPIGDGRWGGTWQPRGSTQQVRVTVTVETADHGLRGTAQVSGGVTSNATIPAIAPNSVVNAASFAAGAPIAPGSLISIFGLHLSDGTNATAPPLPINLGNTIVELSGVALPLTFVSDGQINAIVPYGLPISTRLELVVQHGNALTVPQFISVAPAQPAVFTADGSGSGQGDIFDVTGALVDGSHPAKAGDTVVIYCAGLGAVDQPVTVTLPAPDSPLSNTVNPASVTIGGEAATVSFAGLVPRFAGLYQINAVVPDGVAASNAVPIMISIAGQVSQPVTMAVGK